MLLQTKNLVLQLAENVIKYTISNGKQIYIKSTCKLVDFSEYEAIDKLIVQRTAPDEEFIPLFYNTTTIGQLAFAGTKIQQLILPNTTTTIEYGAFANCTKLQTIKIPGAKFIEQNAFINCDQLVSAIVGNAKYIAYNAFLYCFKIRNFQLLKPRNSAILMEGWPFGITKTTIKCLPNISPFLYINWKADQMLLLEKTNNTRSQVYGTPDQLQLVVDYTDKATLNGSTVRSRAGNIDRKIRPMFGRTLHNLEDNGFREYVKIVALNGFEQISSLGKNVLNGTIVEKPIEIACNVLSANALEGFKYNNTILFNDLDYIGEQAFKNGPEHIEFNGKILSASDFAFDGTIQKKFNFNDNIVKLGYWAFSKKEELPIANTEISADFNCTYSDLEYSSEWPFGLRIENIKAKENTYCSQLKLKAGIHLQKFKSGAQAYCRRSSTICDATNSSGFFASSMQSIIRRNGIAKDEQLDIFFSDKIQYIDPNAFNMLDYKPILHIPNSLVANIA